MSVVLILVGLLARLVLLAAVLAGAAFVAWVLWDCTAGPSARLAAASRREGVRGA